MMCDQPECCDDCRVDDCNGGCGALNVLYPVGRMGLQEKLAEIDKYVTDVHAFHKNPACLHHLSAGSVAKRIKEILKK